MSDADRSQLPGEFQDPLENYDPKNFDDPIEHALAEELVTAMQSQPVATIAPERTIAGAVKQLVELQVACLLVVDDERLIGVFTDRNVLDLVALEWDEVKDKPVREFMTPDPVFVYQSDPSAAALAVMAVLGFRHVPILDVDGKVVGLVSPHRVTNFLHDQLIQASK